MATEILPGFASELTAFEQACDALKAAGYVMSGNVSATWDGSDTRLFATFDGTPAELPPEVAAYKAEVCRKMKEKDAAKKPRKAKAKRK